MLVGASLASTSLYATKHTPTGMSMRTILLMMMITHDILIENNVEFSYDEYVRGFWWCRSRSDIGKSPNRQPKVMRVAISAFQERYTCWQVVPPSIGPDLSPTLFRASPGGRRERQVMLC